MEEHQAKGVMRIYNGDLKLDNEQLTRLFLKQLDHIFGVKNYLREVLPALAEKATFNDLKEAILESIDKIGVQILRMKVIYKIFDTQYTEGTYVGVKSMLEQGPISRLDEKLLPVDMDIALLIQLQIVESVEIAYFDVLKNIAIALQHPEVLILLEQNFEAATDSKKIFELIAREYIN